MVQGQVGAATVVKVKSGEVRAFPEASALRAR
jgi:hypothetical protein